MVRAGDGSVPVGLRGVLRLAVVSLRGHYNGVVVVAGLAVAILGLGCFCGTADG